MLVNPPTSSGFTSQWFNAGDLQNEGRRTECECTSGNNQKFCVEHHLQFLAQPLQG